MIQRLSPATLSPMQRSLQASAQQYRPQAHALTADAFNPRFSGINPRRAALSFILLATAVLSGLGAKYTIGQTIAGNNATNNAITYNLGSDFQTAQDKITAALDSQAMHLDSTAATDQKYDAACTAISQLSKDLDQQKVGFNAMAGTDAQNQACRAAIQTLVDKGYITEDTQGCFLFCTTNEPPTFTFNRQPGTTDTADGQMSANQLVDAVAQQLETQPGVNQAQVEQFRANAKQLQQYRDDHNGLIGADAILILMALVAAGFGAWFGATVTRQPDTDYYGPY